MTQTGRPPWPVMRKPPVIHGLSRAYCSATLKCAPLSARGLPHIPGHGRKPGAGIPVTALGEQLQGAPSSASAKSKHPDDWKLVARMRIKASQAHLAFIDRMLALDTATLQSDPRHLAAMRRAEAKFKQDGSALLMLTRVVRDVVQCRGIA